MPNIGSLGILTLVVIKILIVTSQEIELCIRLYGHESGFVVDGRTGCFGRTYIDSCMNNTITAAQISATNPTFWTGTYK